MDMNLITKTVDYDASKHWKVKRSLTVGTKKGEAALLVHPQPKDVLFDIKESAKLDKKLHKKLVEQSIGRSAAPSK